MSVANPTIVVVGQHSASDAVRRRGPATRTRERWASLIGKVDAYEGSTIRDFLNGDDSLPCPTPCRAESAIPSSAKVVAYDLINRENGTVGERKLFALVDKVACVLAHEGREETARRALETVVGSGVALAAVRTLVAGVR